MSSPGVFKIEALSHHADSASLGPHTQTVTREPEVTVAPEHPGMLHMSPIHRSPAADPRFLLARSPCARESRSRAISSEESLKKWGTRTEKK